MFYTDIVVGNIDYESHSFIITIADKKYDKDFFCAICVNEAIRLYAKFSPTSEVKAIVQYWNGNGTNVVVVDSLGILSMTNGGTNASNGADGLANLFADGKTVLSSYQYGDTLPEAGTVGRIFFKKISE